MSRWVCPFCEQIKFTILGDDRVRCKSCKSEIEYKADLTKLPNILILLMTKNHSKYLKRHLENYERLEYPKSKLRMVISYGESWDETRELLLNFKQFSAFNVEIYNDPPFENKGGISSHWIGDLCEGLKTLVKDEDFIVFMDDDVTYFPPNLLKELIKANKDIVAPYVYIEETGGVFWDTFVFRELDGKNFTLKPPHEDDNKPYKIASAGTILCFKREVFLKVPYGNPAPHLLFCNRAREMGYEVWSLPYVRVFHADVRNERLDWDVKFGGHRRMSETFLPVERGKKKVSREILDHIRWCPFCKSTSIEQKKENYYCKNCREYFSQSKLGEKIIEKVISEWELVPINEFEKITKDSFIPLSEKISISIFAFTGYGGLASVPDYLQEGFNKIGIRTQIFPLEFNQSSDITKEMVRKADDYIFFIHYDRLASIVKPLFEEAKKLNKRVIVFPTDSWMDKKREIRELFYRDAYRIIAYADWIKNYLWNGECKGFGQDPQKIVVMRFGVRRSKKFSYDEHQKIREKLGVKTRYLIGEMGFVRRGKGFIHIIPMLKNLKDVTFLILGSTDPTEGEGQNWYARELIKRIQKYRVEDRVIWLNRYIEEPEIDEFLGACDLILVPTLSRTDTSGALNLSIGIGGGKPVLTTPQRTRREIKRKYRAIAVYPIEDFEEGIKYCLESSNLIKLTKNSERYTKKYNWTMFARRLVKLFNNILEIKERKQGDYPKVLIATAIKFDTKWQKKALEKNLEQIVNLDYPSEKLRIIYMCATEKEGQFIEEYFSDKRNFEVICIVDSSEHKERMGDYARHSVHFYAPLFNRMREEITDDIDYVFLVDADYIVIPPESLKQLLEYDVDIISPYLYFEHGTFFDTYGFATEDEREFCADNPPFDKEKGIVKLAYAGTGVQLIKAEILRKIAWVNPDSWLHWCWTAKEEGYEVWGAPEIRMVHGAGYHQAGKESRSMWDLVYSRDVNVDTCIKRGLFTMDDWRRYLRIKWNNLPQSVKDALWNKTIQEWINKGEYEEKEYYL